MTVSSEQSFIEYNGDGATQTFSVPFYFILNSDISVTVADASGNLDELTYGVDFSASGGGNPDGGTATLNTAYASGYTILIYRNPPETQETAYYENGKFPAKSHEKALDKLTMLIQKYGWWFDTLALKKPSYLAQYYDAQGNRISNLADPVNAQDAVTKSFADAIKNSAVRVPEASVALTPTINGRKNRLFAWDDNGNPIAVLAQDGTASAVLIELAKNDGFKLIGQVPDVATLRTVEPTSATQRILLREYTSGTGYGGGQLRAVLDGSSYTDNGVTVFKTTGGAAWIRVNSDIVNPLMAGAVPDGITPCSSAINAMFASSKRMQFTGGDYLLDATITLQSDRSVDFGASRLIQGTSLANYMFAIRGSNTSSSGGVFVGTGTRTNSIAAAIIIADTSYSKVSGAIVRRAPGAGIQIINGTRCSIINCISENNWGNGLEDRYGNFNEIINSIGNYNGYLSETEIFNGGRGCLGWKSTGTTFRGNQTFGNSEYGIRVYSQTGDDAVTRYIHIFDHISGDNGKIDIYIYNDAGNLLNIELSNCHVHRWNQSNSGSYMVALQGTRCHWNGGSITKYGDIYDAAAVSFSNGDNITFENTSITNVTSAFGNTANNTTVRNCTINSSLVITGTGTGSTAGYLTFEACSFNHTGSGTTDIALTVTSATRLNNCRFNGFYRNVSWTNEPLILTACHSTNTTGDAIRMYGDGVGAYYSSGCRWDIATVPAWLGSLVKQGTALPVLYDTAAPTTLTWPRGSRCINSAPAVGSPKEWVCVTAGTPGTWQSTGNL